MTEPVTIGDCTRIYGLTEPDNYDVVRYVGKTVQPLHRRLRAHKRAALRGGRLPVHYWLRKRVDIQFGPAIKWLETVEAGDDWQEREQFWIGLLRALGCDLLNLTAGGEGLPGHKFSADHRSKIATALRTGGHFNCEKCGTKFWRKRNQILSGQNRFCSRACSNARNRPPGLFDAP